MRPERVEFVDEWTLREMFNDGDYWGRVLDGELSALTVEEGVAPARAGQPAGTVSRLDFIYERGHKVAEVHYYQRPDGSIGGSGEPDPKSLLIDGVLYELEGRPGLPPDLPS
jgi:hypothetical protein